MNSIRNIDTPEVLHQVCLSLANASKRFTQAAQTLKDYGMPESTGHVADDAKEIEAWLLGPSFKWIDGRELIRRIDNYEIDSEEAQRAVTSVLLEISEMMGGGTL